MTGTELSEKFDIKIRQRIKTPFDTDEYEKSLFLTEAQETLIRDKYYPLFEVSEFSRQALSPITTPYSTSSISYNSNVSIALESDLKSGFINKPSDMWLIAQEQLKLSNSVIRIEPIRHDEYNELKSNPFKKPNSRKGWRLDLNSNGDKIELILSSGISEDGEYNCRYIRQCKPIILPDATIKLTPDGGEDMSIGGITEETIPELHPMVHEEILNLAVDIAIKTITNK